MTFKTPSATQYLGSLMIAGILCIIAYLALSSQGITDLAYFLTVGLLLGHLVGTFSSRRGAVVRNTSTHAGAEQLTSLYVGNLAYRAQRDDLQNLFARYGEVHSVRIMTDRVTRKPRGYGFVEMDSAGAQRAILELDNTELCGRSLRVSEAKQRPAE